MSQEQLKRVLNALEQFQKNRTAILQKAFDEGGQSAVSETVAQFDELDSFYNDLLRGQLDNSNEYYKRLLQASNQETKKLAKSIEKLSNVNEVAGSVSSLLTSVIQIISSL